MSYYKTCPYCGAHLDPGEKCDCPAQIAEDAILKDVRLAIEKSAPSGADTGGGKAENIASTVTLRDMIYANYTDKKGDCQG